MNFKQKYVQMCIKHFLFSLETSAEQYGVIEKLHRIN